MAKSTKAQMVSTGTPDSYTEHELTDPDPAPRVRRAMLGGDPESVGMDSSESLSNESQSSEQETVNPQEPALTTESLSGRTETEDSTVNSMDGDGPETETESVDIEEVPPYAEWEYRELQAECKERELPASGSTEDLIARLEEFDEQVAADSDFS